jgi:flagellar biosynthesis protein FliR
VLAMLGSSQLDPSWYAVTQDALITTALGEFIIGAFMGFGTRLVFAILEVGGIIIGMQMGLAMAQTFNPGSEGQSTVVQTWAYLFGLILAVVTDWYQQSIGYWVLSFRFYPPGSWWLILDGVGGLGRVLGAVFVMGVQMAAPVLALILLVNLTFAFLGKVAPQVNVLMLSFAVRIAVGAVALIAVVLLAKALFEDASSWILPYTLKPTFPGGGD